MKRLLGIHPNNHGAIRATSRLASGGFELALGAPIIIYSKLFSELCQRRNCKIPATFEGVWT